MSTVPTPPLPTVAGLLTGRVAIVTGAGQGVGEGIAASMAAAGAAVVIAARRAETGEPAAERIRANGGTAVFERCDVTNRADVDAAVAAAIAQFDRLDTMVHNAVSPPGPPRPIQEIDDETIALQIATSTTASFHCAQAAFPHLQADYGSLILLTSPAGIEGSGNLPLYGAVKGAQRGLLKSLAREWGPAGVRVNAIAPVAWTPAMDTATAANPTLEARLRGRTPLQRIGDPTDDIGPVAVFLASSLSRHMTGQTLAVDGGRYLGL
ncbi:MAG: NAD(P)-dependent dehydrogenase (short-subunit alcohol dehydrogenase family) [Candidatus Aldehydirespiratoraceae bacterium]|jgi:NAD(P)-dependent dehydrogenase (short-subunit alcohol dehydrogenase family)